MRFFERDLRVKVTATLLLLVVAALIAVGLVSHAIAMRIVTNSVTDSMLDSARLSRDLLQVALERRQSRQDLFSSSPLLRDPGASNAAKNEFISFFTQTWPLGLGAVLLDTAGNPITGTGALSGIGNVSQATWFKNAQTAGVAFTYVRSPSELSVLSLNSPILVVSKAVRDAKDQIFAYIVSFTTMSDITSAIDSIRIKKTGHAFLIDGGGHIIAGHLFGTGRVQNSKKAKALVDELREGGEGNLTFTYGDTKDLVAYTPVEPSGVHHPEVDWIVGVVVPAGQAYGPVHSITWALFGLTAFFILLSTAAAVLLGRSIARPTKELAASAERMGSGDLTADVVIRTRDQIGTLAAALIRMRDFLRSTLAETRYSSERMSVLAEEQSAATNEVFAEAEEIVDSAALLAKNMEAQTEKIRKIAEYVSMMPQEARSSQPVREVQTLLEEAVILAEVGMGKAVEIASATQEQRAAARGVAAAARRLSEVARELKSMVEKFKV